MVQNLSANAGDVGSIPESGRSLGEGNGNPLQYFLPGKSHGQSSLVGYSRQGHKKVRHDSATNQQQLQSKPPSSGDKVKALNV